MQNLQEQETDCYPPQQTSLPFFEEEQKEFKSGEPAHLVDQDAFQIVAQPVTIHEDSIICPSNDPQPLQSSIFSESSSGFI